MKLPPVAHLAVFQYVPQLQHALLARHQQQIRILGVPLHRHNEGGTRQTEQRLFRSLRLIPAGQRHLLAPHIHAPIHSRGSHQRDIPREYLQVNTRHHRRVDPSHRLHLHHAVAHRQHQHPPVLAAHQQAAGARVEAGQRGGHQVSFLFGALTGLRTRRRIDGKEILQVDGGDGVGQ